MVETKFLKMICKMNKVSKFLFAICVIIVLSCSNSDSNQTNIDHTKERSPNIILVMGDDMGWSDIGCYGGEINTPRLDALAANGLRFTQFYNSARCCPTRASLLTGLYPQQAGVGHMVYDRGTPAFKGDLSFNAVTLGEAMRSNGYATYLSGKWHVTPYVIENPNKHNWPLQRGFDKFFGMISGAGSLYDPRSLTLDNDYVAPRDGFYSTTDFTNFAVDCIDQHTTDNPFFMYVSYQAAHWPMHAPAEAIAKYQGKYDTGWDVLRKNRYEKLISMGLVNTSWELTPRDSFVNAWTDDIPDRDWEIANMETYAAMTTLMDEGIGRIVDKLEQERKLENTIIFYLQDNGACAEELEWVDTSPNPDSLQLMEPGELQWKMVPTITRDGKPVTIQKDGWPGGAESYTAYGLNWANASNTPFREYKHWVHEGGISTPLIAHWPAGIKAKGAYRTEPTHLIDIMSTCVDLGGGNYPETYNGNTIQPMEGKSLVPAFENKSLKREAIYWEHEGNRAIRMGKWKLISKARKKNSYIWDKNDEIDLSNWELFDMENDRTEMNDIASTNINIVTQMSDLWLAWGKRTGIVPRPE